MKGEFISIETTQIMAYMEKENKELQEQNKILQEKLNDAREYISAQKDEIKELKNLCDKYEEEHKTTFNQWESDINKYQTLKNLQQRIDKAIEYYKMHQQECVIGRNKDDKLIKDYYLPARCSKVLLNILEGKYE